MNSLRELLPNTLLQKAIHHQNMQSAPPVWMMRQAGRYHRHYQKMKSHYTFEQMCKDPDLSAETAMGPIEDFDFDAAILFSDILFPLEAMGIPLEFSPGPKLGFLLDQKQNFSRLKKTSASEHPLFFQAEAAKILRSRLDPRKSLIGFAGAPWTLFVFASCGSHKKSLDAAVSGLYDGRFDLFCEYAEDLVFQSLSDQIQSGCDVVSLFDTAAGDMPSEVIDSFLLPSLQRVMTRLKNNFPHIPILYYPKKCGEFHWQKFQSLPFDILGVDHFHSLKLALEKFSMRWAIQGNFAPENFLKTEEEFQKELKHFFELVLTVDSKYRSSWICGLGHGILPGSCERKVQEFIQKARSTPYRYL